MKPIPLRMILLCLALGLGAVTLTNSLLVRSGGGELVMSPIVVVVCLFMGGGALWLGCQVARWRNIETRAKAKNMNPVAAARVLAYAQGSILTGATLSGWMLGLLVYQLSLVAVRGLTGAFWVTAVNLLGAAALLGMGLWAQHLCRIPPDDSAGASAGGGSLSAPDTGSYARSDGNPYGGARRSGVSTRRCN